MEQCIYQKKEWKVPNSNEECPKCGGSGVQTDSQKTECLCKGNNPECPQCDGSGFYYEDITVDCSLCDGTGIC